MGLFNWLFKKQSAPCAGAPLKIGDRVLAKWLDPFFYPGSIRSISAQGYLIAFDDGDSGWVHPAHVLMPDIQVGSKVFCRIQGGPYYFPGTISEQNGEQILVRYDQGGEEWTSLAMVRVERPIANIGQDGSVVPQQGILQQGLPQGMPQQGVPQPFPPALQPAAPMNMPMMLPPGMQPGFMPGMQPGFPVGMSPGALDVGPPLKDSDWAVGDRVLARWLDFFWYPGSILAMGAHGFHILFDDGGQRLVQNINFMPLAVEEGEQIFIRPKTDQMRMYHPAHITRVDGETIDVEFEDGRQETNTKVSRARFWRCPVRVPSFPYEEGDRVLALDMDEYIYPAEIVSIQEDRVIVQFLDGPERPLTPERIQRFELRAGVRIECRWRGGSHFYAGSVAQLDGERVCINYDHGVQEWTSIRLVRIPPSSGR